MPWCSMAPSRGWPRGAWVIRPFCLHWKAIDASSLRPLDHGDLFETVLAEQVILEGLGEAILTRIEQGLAKRDAPFGRLRRILLKQEEAYHGFGCRLLEGALSAGDLKVERLRARSRSQEYLALTDAMVLTLSDVFETIDEDAAAWAADVRTFLPRWLTA
jgi:hypothetical protein